MSKWIRFRTEDGMWMVLNAAHIVAINQTRRRKFPSRTVAGGTYDTVADGDNLFVNITTRALAQATSITFYVHHEDGKVVWSKLIAMLEPETVTISDEELENI